MVINTNTDPQEVKLATLYSNCIPSSLHSYGVCHTATAYNLPIFHLWNLVRRSKVEKKLGVLLFSRISEDVPR